MRICENQSTERTDEWEREDSSSSLHILTEAERSEEVRASGNERSDLRTASVWCSESLSAGLLPLPGKVGHGDAHPASRAV